MKTFLLVASVLFSMVIHCQSHGSVSGTITDMEMNGEPLLFANIELKDTQWRAQTNLNGNFEIFGIAPGSYILAIGFPGYETLEIPIDIKGDKRHEVRRELFAKSIDVGTLLRSKSDSKTETAALTYLPSK